MSRSSRNTLKALAALVLTTTFAACSDTSLTQPGDLAPQAAQHDASITSTLVCASPANTTYLGAPAFAIAANPAWGSLGGSAGWVGPFANSGTTNVAVGYYTFTTTFPATDGDAISGQILADNGATVSVAGKTIATIGATTAADQAVVGTFQTASGFTGVTEGANTLTVTLFNSGFSPFDQTANPTGVSYCFTVRTCPAAPAVANAYLKSINYASNKQGKVISAVAQHMGQGATFDGLGKCDDGYAKKVSDFVTNYIATH